MSERNNKHLCNTCDRRFTKTVILNGVKPKEVTIDVCLVNKAVVDEKNKVVECNKYDKIE